MIFFLNVAERKYVTFHNHFEPQQPLFLLTSATAPPYSYFCSSLADLESVGAKSFLDATARWRARSIQMETSILTAAVTILVAAMYAMEKTQNSLSFAALYLTQLGFFPKTLPRTLTQNGSFTPCPFTPPPNPCTLSLAQTFIPRVHHCCKIWRPLQPRWPPKRHFWARQICSSSFYDLMTAKAANMTRFVTF